MTKSKKMTIIALTCFLMTVALSIVASAQDYPWGAEETAFFMGLGLTVCLILIIVPLVIAILACIWIYKDAEKRGKQGILWVLLLILAAIFLSFIGLIIVIVVWLAIRPPVGGEKKEQDRRCPNCGRSIPMDAKACPYCAKKFEE
ncbi:MAG: zinc ribbon domain-containing protein [Thermoplasmatales archaeon]|nr:MAG: zinc ribbon domain-containing protein [Thermoplasmatales archaeon]